MRPDHIGPNWRSPLTNSTWEEVLVLRQQHRERVAHVNAALLILFAEREAIRLALLEKENEVET